jgi:hypothetical protein
MSARRKLNSVYLAGAVGLAAGVGRWCESWWAFAGVLVVAVALAVEAGHIRLTRARR